MSSRTANKDGPVIPRPSSSIVLISPTNQVLLLHRVQTSTSFPSAHVFPGGNVSDDDGPLPPADDPNRHTDSTAYRLAAVRETFEESGILLARHANHDRLLEVDERERDRARRAVHSGNEVFPKWLMGLEGVPDIEGLIPFTRWITPREIPKRYTTQMYLYFLPVSAPSSLGQSNQIVIPTPSSDGGIEHTAAEFLHAATWLDMARSGEIILFPPQYFLLFLVSKFLTPPLSETALSSQELEKQRRNLTQFVFESDPPWTDVTISPTTRTGKPGRGKWVLDLGNSGPECQGRSGAKGYVAVMGMLKGLPSGFEIMLEKDLLDNREPNL